MINVKRFFIVISTVLAFAIGVSAQESGGATGTSSPQTTQSSDQQNQPAPSVKPDSNEKKSDKKKKKDKKEAAAAQQDAQDTGIFSQREANDVLRQIRDGLEGHSQRLMLRAFDGDKMDGYLSFEDQLESFFNRYEGFRVNIRVLQNSIEGGKGVILASFQMEATPHSGTPTRREGQLRFEVEHTNKGWKVVDVNPRSFFS
jgi:hypothetical protein